MKNIIIFVNLWEPLPTPKQRERFYRAGQLFKYCSKKYNCIYVSSRFDHIKKIYRKKAECENIILLNTTPYFTNSGILRIISQIISASSLFIFLLKTKSIQKVVVSLPTIENFYVCTLLSKILKYEVIVDIRDNWPDSFTKFYSGYKVIIGLPLIKLYRWMLRSALKNTKKIITVSNEYKTWLKNDYGVNKVQVIYHAYNNYCISEVEQKLNTVDCSKRLIVTFCGTLGDTYDIEGFLSQIAKLDNFKNYIEVKIVGDGPNYIRLKDKYNYLQNVVFTGRLDKNELHKILITSHVGLLLYKKNAPQSIGNKFAEYCSYGLILLNTLIGEQSEFIDKYKCGINIDIEQKTYRSALGELLNLTEEERLVAMNNSYNLYKRKFQPQLLYKGYYIDIINQ